MTIDGRQRPGSGATGSGSGGASQVVRFYVGAQQYAVDIMRVAEVIEPVAIAPVPHAPRFVEGIIELRGRYLAVVDLGARFGVTAAAAGDGKKYVVVSYGATHLGLIVDRVLDVRRMADGEAQRAPELVSGAAGRFVSGVVTWDGEIALVLDLDALFSAEELASWRASAAAGGLDA